MRGDAGLKLSGRGREIIWGLHLQGQKGRHPLSQKFHDSLRELGDMHDRKQADYGSDTNPFANVVDGAIDIGIEPWKGALLRMNDKMKRLNRAARTGKLTNEGVEDSLIDLAVYAMIALVIRRETAREAAEALEEVNSALLTVEQARVADLQDHPFQDYPRDT